MDDSNTQQFHIFVGDKSFVQDFTDHGRKYHMFNTKEMKVHNV